MLPDRVDRSSGINVASDLVSVHVRGVGKALGETMVLLNDGIENISEEFIGILISSIDTTVLVIELNSTSNGLSKSESRGLGLESSKLGPFFRGDVLSYQTVSGFNVREWRSLKEIQNMKSTIDEVVKVKKDEKNVEQEKRGQNLSYMSDLGFT